MTVPTTMKIRSRKRSMRVSEAPGTAASWPNGEANLSRSNRHAAARVERGSPAPVSPSSEDHMSRRPYLVPAFLAIAARLVAQSAADARWLAECRDRDDGGRVRHWEVRVSSVRATGGTIAIDPGTNGGVAVRGWDLDSIEVHARIQTQAPSEEAATELAHRILIATSATTIGVDGPAGRHDASWGGSFVGFAPRRSDLKLDTYNGPIAVSDLSGRLTVTAYNGPVALRAVGGDVRARTTNGPLAIELTGARWEGVGLDAQTTNGPVQIAIPDGYSAQLEFGTERPDDARVPAHGHRSEEHTSELQSRLHLVCRLLLEKKKK